MLFNSLEFAIFLPLTFILYWFVVNRQLKLQNVFLVAASYLFYGWWDYRFLALILFSSIVDYLVGIGLSSTDKKSKRKLFLLLSICVNLGFLGVFKYFNFFAESFSEAFTFFGTNFDPIRLNIILPVGISFYTFQTLSYSIDVYRKKLEPTRDFVAFIAFVSFFPQLVAGPIERATNLLPQFYKKRQFDYDKAVDGMRQILWGLFKKMVIADNCAIYVNEVFGNYVNHSGSTLLLGAVFFAFQIYGDFSGYSDIAIGTARLFGFDLKRNFAFPYFSRDIGEFWRRWHISLSTWFRDYLYIPLGGSRGSKWMQIRNVFIIFLVSGFWHGANWTFLIWGFINALYFLPLLLRKTNRSHLDTVAENTKLPSFKELIQMLITFFITVLAWIFFRANSLQMALDYIYGIFSNSIVEKPFEQPTTTMLLLVLFIIIEWIQRKKLHGFDFSNSSYQTTRYYRWPLYIAAILMIFFFGATQQEFIYFQF